MLRYVVELWIGRVAGHVERRSRRAFVGAGIFAAGLFLISVWTNGSIFPGIWFIPVYGVLGLLVACPILPLPPVRAKRIGGGKEMGAVVSFLQGPTQIVVMMERGIYSYAGRSDAFGPILEMLSRGEWPSAMNGRSIGWEQVREVALHRKTNILTVRPGKQGGSQLVFWESDGTFAQIVASVTAYRGVTPKVEERGLDVWYFLRFFLVCLAVAGASGIWLWATQGNGVNPPPIWVLGMITGIPSVGLAGLSGLGLLFALATQKNKVRIVATFEDAAETVHAVGGATPSRNLG